MRACQFQFVKDLLRCILGGGRKRLYQSSKRRFCCVPKTEASGGHTSAPVHERPLVGIKVRQYMRGLWWAYQYAST